MDGEMRWVEAGGWLSHWLARAKEHLFTHRPRHRPVHYGGREFSAPQPWMQARLPRAPGLYAIQVRHWWSGMKPIHFGEAENLHEDLMMGGAEGFVHWLMHRGSRQGIFVSFHTSEELAHPHIRSGESMRLLRHYFPHRTHSMQEHMQRHRIHHVPRLRHPHREVQEGDSIR